MAEPDGDARRRWLFADVVAGLGFIWIVSGAAEGSEAVLIVGPYLCGKSSVAAEIAGILEQRGDPFALLDLDYLGWANAPGYDGHGDDPWLLLANLRAVTGSFVAAGCRRFVVAGHVPDRARLDAIVGALEMPVKVVRLEVPMAELQRRAAADPTTGRAADLADAASERAAGAPGIEDFTLRNDGPIRATADDVVGWLGWA